MIGYGTVEASSPLHLLFHKNNSHNALKQLSGEIQDSTKKVNIHNDLERISIALRRPAEQTGTGCRVEKEVHFGSENNFLPPLSPLIKQSFQCRDRANTGSRKVPVGRQQHAEFRKRTTRCSHR